MQTDSILLRHGPLVQIVEPAFFRADSRGYIFGDRSEKQVLQFSRSGNFSPTPISIGERHGELLTLFGGGADRRQIAAYDFNSGKILMLSRVGSSVSEVRLRDEEMGRIRSVHMSDSPGLLFVRYPFGHAVKEILSLRFSDGESVDFLDAESYYNSLPARVRGVAMPRADYASNVVVVALVGREELEFWRPDGSLIRRVSLPSDSRVLNYSQLSREFAGNLVTVDEHGDSVIVGGNRSALSSVHVVDSLTAIMAYLPPVPADLVRGRFDSTSLVRLVGRQLGKRRVLSTGLLSVPGGVVGVDVDGKIVSVRRDDITPNTWLLRHRLNLNTEECR